MKPSFFRAPSSPPRSKRAHGSPGPELGPRTERRVEAISYDVFETCLVRRIGAPRAFHGWVGRRLRARGLSEMSPEVFAVARSDAERRTFHFGLDHDRNLETIYEELRFSLQWSHELARLALEEELELERELLVPVERIRREIARYRRQGCRILFTSDMYLPSRFIRARLVEHGIAAPDDPIFVSNEFSASKDSGRLFRIAADLHSLEPRRILHVGNSERTDVESARREGLAARHFGEGNLNRFEKILHDHHVGSCGFSSVLAGCSRYVRLSRPVASSHDEALVRVASGVVAPFLIGMTSWLMERAASRGISRMYFVARDGQILSKLAQRWSDRLGLGIECRYLLGSRAAWALPSFTNMDERQVETIVPSEVDVPASLDEILDRLDMTIGDLDRIAPSHGLPRDRRLRIRDRAELRRLLMESPLRDHALARGRAARELMLEYLESEGMMDGIPMGFCDLGGGATLQYMLSEVLAERGVTLEHGYYFALRETAVEPRGGYPDAYWGNAIGSPRGAYHSRGLISTLEAAASGDHGTVLGYERTPSGVRPLCAPSIADSLFAWGLQTVRDVVMEMVEAIPLKVRGFSTTGDLRPALAAVHDAFWQAPRPDEARAWGSFPMEDGWGTRAKVRPLAEPLGLHACHWAFRCGAADYRRHLWVEGSRQISSPPMRASIHHVARIGRGAKKLRSALRARGVPV